MQSHAAWSLIMVVNVVKATCANFTYISKYSHERSEGADVNVSKESGWHMWVVDLFWQIAFCCKISDNVPPEKFCSEVFNVYFNRPVGDLYDTLFKQYCMLPSWQEIELLQWNLPWKL